MRRSLFASALSAVLLVTLARPSSGEASFTVGQKVTLTHEAVLNGTTLPKGTSLRVVKVRPNEKGDVVRIDLELLDGEHKVFKSLTPEAVVAMSSPAGEGGTASNLGDRAHVLKVAAQIPLMRDLTLQHMAFSKGTVLQVDRVKRDKKGKISTVDLRETTGKLRLVRGVVADELLDALAPEEVTWPDGAVGATLVLLKELELEDVSLPRGTKVVVTRVEKAKRAPGVVKVSLRELGAEGRELRDVPIAVLKRSASLGSAEGAPR